MSRTKTSSPLDNFGGANPSRLDPTDETVVLTVRVPRRVAREIEMDAAERGMTRSEYVRERLSAPYGSSS
jgi:hypothetical protein